MTTDRGRWIKVFTGKTFGDYTLLEYIGGGEYGYVFKAEASGKADHVAVKVLRPNAPADDSMEFEREGELLQALRRSSGVVDLHLTDLDTLPFEASGVTLDLQVQYHVMELAYGCLEELISAPGYDDIPWEERLRLWRGVALGVHQMHMKDIVHRDLKSSNCLLVLGAGGTTTAKVADLGKSRDLSAPARYPGRQYLVARGDLRFAPPELLLWQGKDEPKSHRLGDLYGLGSLLFELAVGVGITQFALGFGPDIVQRAQVDAANGVVPDLSGLRPAFSTAFETFAQAVPKGIRHEARQLIQQICDPEPEMRLPKRAYGRRRTSDANLDWLLRRADILIRRLTSAN